MKPASKAQTFAIFCALKVDVRACNLTYDAAHAILTRANSGERDAAYKDTVALPGAVAKGKPASKPAVSSKPDYASVWSSAWQAGQRAASACVPVPMVVTEHANPLDDSSPVVKRYAPIEAGVCGFASVRFAGNTAFGKWAKANGLARPSCTGGLYTPIHDYNQSYERKSAHAYAMAAELTKHGFTAYGESRLD